MRAGAGRAARVCCLKMSKTALPPPPLPPLHPNLPTPCPPVPFLPSLLLLMPFFSCWQVRNIEIDRDRFFSHLAVEMFWVKGRILSLLPPPFIYGREGMQKNKIYLSDSSHVWQSIMHVRQSMCACMQKHGYTRHKA